MSYQILTKTAWGLSSTSLRQFRAFSITTLEENFACTTPTAANSSAARERTAHPVTDLIVNYWLCFGVSWFCCLRFSIIFGFWAYSDELTQIFMSTVCIIYYRALSRVKIIESGPHFPLPTSLPTANSQLPTPTPKPRTQHSQKQELNSHNASKRRYFRRIM